MLTRRILVAFAAAVLGLVVAPTAAWGSPSMLTSPVIPPGCNAAGCGIGIDVPGSPGGGGQPGAGGSGSGGSASGSSVSSGGESEFSAEQCWKTLDPPPVASSALWEGNDSGSGAIQYNSCIKTYGGSGPVLLAGSPTRFVANGQPAGNAPPPPPDPAVLAQQAYQLIPIPKPVMHFGPNADQIAVRYWLYLWTDNPGDLSRTVTAGGISVTATAKLTSVTWNMGSSSAEGQGSTITCNGNGKPAPENADVVNDPRPAGYCAFMYQLRSTPERTGGAGTWPVTAAATWTVTWTATTGETGQITAPPFTSAAGLCVGAWSTVNVADGYTPPTGTCQT